MDLCIRVLIIADDPLARAGIAALLENRGSCSVVGSLTSEGISEEILDVYRPDVLLWDVGWEQSSSTSTEIGKTVEWMEVLAEDGPPIVALLADDSQLFERWRAGARGLLDREATESELVAAIQAVAEGLTVVHPGVGSRLFPSLDGLEFFPLETLTSREMEVIQLMAEGLANKTIAHHLDVSEHTVKFHINTIFRKLGAQSRTDAVVRAYRLGLILI